jgi:circadian clock protein KaiC
MHVRDENGDLAATGIPGLDHILEGGFTRDRLYLVEGVPGSGKTTLALQFLLEGARLHESTLYVTLSETRDELEAVTRSRGWDLTGIEIQEFIPEDVLQPGEQYTMFQPSEVELATTMAQILGAVERLKPTRVVLDSLSELRLVAGNPLKYRRQILALKQFFAGRACTVMLLDDMTATDHDLQVQSIAHAVVLLEQLNPEYGTDRRRLRVVKYRGKGFKGGYHDYVIDVNGLQVFPRLVAADYRHSPTTRQSSSGIGTLDMLLGGGIEEGSSTLVLGAAGTGKSTLAASFVAAAAGRGQKAAMFLFDEAPRSLLSRCEAVGIKLRALVESGHVVVTQVDPAELSPGQFMCLIQKAVEEDGASVIVIDSLNGYLQAMPEERFLIIQLHELLTYLGQRSVATILIGAYQGLIGPQMTTPVDASYLADSVLLLRYFETDGEVRQAISVMKKRGGAHERTVREFGIRSGGIYVGDILRDFTGVLSGMPVYSGMQEPLMSKD